MPWGAVLTSTIAAAVPAETVRERARAILSLREYQTALPEPGKSWDLPLGWLDLVLRAAFWAAIVAGVVLLAVWAWRHLAGRTRDAVAPAEDAAPVAELGGRPLVTAEALAAEGRFGEAIHALLLLTLEALSRAARLPASLTSREIVERIALPAPAREALGGLVASVEVSWFGGASPGEGEWRQCLDRFQAFLATYRSGS